MNDENFGNSGRVHDMLPVYGSPARPKKPEVTFELDIDAVGKNARALQGIFIVNGKPLVTTYEIRDFVRKLSRDKKRVTVKLVD